MKKELKAELHDLAIQILKLDSNNDVSNLKVLARDLYEKLSILEFNETLAEDSQSIIESQDNIEVLDDVINTQVNEEVKPDLTPKELVRKESQPVVEQVSQDSQENSDDIQVKTPLSNEEREYNERQRKLEALEAKNYMKNDMAHIGGVSYDDLPEFEPVATPEQPEQPKKNPDVIAETTSKISDKSPKLKKKSLNDLNRGIKIGLNDRIAFIKHLFDGSAGDYNRVLSQLNTHSNFEDANNFLDTVVKPDYNNWEDKDLYAQRFKEVVEKRFN